MDKYLTKCVIFAKIQRTIKSFEKNVIELNENQKEEKSNKMKKNKKEKKTK